MYFIVAKDRKENWYIEQIVKDWHDVVDGFEPIDCTKDEMAIFNETGSKFLVGPDKGLADQKVGHFGGWVNVSEWDFKNGEPFLLDTQETDQNGLRSMLIEYMKRNRLHIVVEPETLSFDQVVEAIKQLV